MVNISRYQVQLVKESTKRYDIDKIISSPDSAYEAFKELFKIEIQAEEIFCILALDTKNKIIGAFEVSRGNLNTSLVHPREVFKRLILLNAHSFIMAHNHPSGDISQASREDDALTKRIKECSHLIGINLHDHIIVGDYFYSYAENGLL